MESRFNVDLQQAAPSEIRVKVGESRHFLYFQTRLHGTLHFVKKLKPEFIGDLLATEALRKEFVLGYGLTHPGIVRYFFLGDNEIFEEYIDGENLRELIVKKDPRLNDGKFLKKVAKEILEALSYLHKKGILHLDLKPENVMITRTGDQVKIIDLSCAYDSGNDSTPGFTEGYEAPGQKEGKVDVATDLYQIGILLRELATTGGKLNEWKSFIAKCINSDPAKRFSNADEALKFLSGERGPFAKKVKYLIGALILAGLISIIIINPFSRREEEILVDAPEESREAKPEELNEKIMPEEAREEASINNKSGKNEEGLKIQAPALNEEKIPDAPNQKSIEKELENKISRKLDELYSARVTPMYNEIISRQERGEAITFGTDFIDNYMSALEKLKAYGQELGNAYPDNRDFIEEKVKTAFESKTYKMIQKIETGYSANRNSKNKEIEE